MIRNPSGDRFEERLREQLREAEPPADGVLRADLWPRMRQRIEEQARSGRARPQIIAVPWFDWALMGVAGAAVLFFPALIPALLYHL